VDKMVAVAAVLVVVFIGLLTYWLFKIERIRWKFDKLSGPRTIPIFGNALQLKRTPREFTEQLEEICEQYGPDKVFRLNLGFGYTLVLISAAEEAEPIMNSSKHMDKSPDYNFLHPWLGTGLLTSTGEKWKIRRKLLTPTFHFKILHDFLAVFNDQSRTLQKKLAKHADGKTYNVFNDITLCALDIICETAMGRSVNAQLDKDSEYVEAVYRASEYAFKRMRNPFFWPRILFNTIGPGRQMDKTLRILHGFTEKVIRERQAEFSRLHDDGMTMDELLDKQGSGSGQGKKRLAFLDMLLCATADGEKLSFGDIREEVDTFMFEGHDTTAMSSNWCVHLIGGDKEVHTKVHQEMDKIFGDSDRDATMDDLKEMKYLECCIKEALRIFPSVPFFGRTLTEDTVIGGLDMEKGTTVVIVPAAIHRDKRYFPDPEVFDPDRFLPENANDRHPFAYIPFSAGLRNCIGQKFALMEEKVILSSIFRKFNVESTQTREELHPMAELILRPENGIEVKLTPRKA